MWYYRLLKTNKAVFVANMSVWRYCGMFIYENNEQLKKELKKVIIDSGLTQKEVAERMECKPQQYTNIVNKENLAFRDVKRIANAVGLDVKIEFVPVENDEK